MLRKMVFLRSFASHFAETKVGRTEGYSCHKNNKEKILPNSQNLELDYPITQLTRGEFSLNFR